MPLKKANTQNNTQDQKEEKGEQDGWKRFICNGTKRRRDSTWIYLQLKGRNGIPSSIHFGYNILPLNWLFMEMFGYLKPALPQKVQTHNITKASQIILKNDQQRPKMINSKKGE